MHFLCIRPIEDGLPPKPSLGHGDDLEHPLVGVLVHRRARVGNRAVTWLVNPQAIAILKDRDKRSAKVFGGHDDLRVVIERVIQEELHQSLIVDVGSTGPARVQLLHDDPASLGMVPPDQAGMGVLQSPVTLIAADPGDDRKVCPRVFQVVSQPH